MQDAVTDFDTALPGTMTASAMIKSGYAQLVAFAVMQCLAVDVLRADAELPSPGEVVQKVLQRAQWAKEQNFQQVYSFTKITLTEEFDSRGILKDSHTDSRRVRARGKAAAESSATPDGGTDSDRLVSQLRRAQTGDPDRKRSYEIDDETVSRFQFRALRREMVSGRSTLVFAFQARPDAAVDRVQDRLLNKTAGIVWVDESEYEVVKAEIRLQEPVTFWGGFVGAVHAFDYVFERTRVDEGVWLLTQTEMRIKARQFFNSIFTRKKQNWSDFRRGES